MRIGLGVLVASLLGLWAMVPLGEPLVEPTPATSSSTTASLQAPTSTSAPAPTRTLTPTVAASSTDVPSSGADPGAGAATTLRPSEHELVTSSRLVAPMRLAVPSLGVDAEIVTTGVDAEGQFAVPGPAVVGWYEHGPAPGEPGSAVLAAHVDWDRRPGVFADLALLVDGDRIEIVAGDGERLVFEVIDQTLYDKSALPATDLFSEGGEPVVRLITCGGTFDRSTGHYVGNRVVTALRVEA